MSPEFYAYYLQPNSISMRLLLAVMNPEKFRICQYLINYHERRNDKVILQLFMVNNEQIILVDNRFF
jgi:DNA excision repair protein ERCC-3